MENIKVLIVGAGVAGLTMANLLVQHGIEPTIVEWEKEGDYNRSGYMLGLLPLGGRVFNELGLRDEYFSKSIQMDLYNVHSADGKMIRSYPLEFINKQYGSYRGISRIDLIDLLLERLNCQQILFDTSVTGLVQGENEAEVRFSNEKTEVFDVVVIADGMHSESRNLILNESQYHYNDTGWGGWASWLEEEPANFYDEYWGAGSFLGLYPVVDRIGIFLGGPTSTIQSKGLNNFVSEVADGIENHHPLLRMALKAFRADDDPFFWKFQDCRSDLWYRGNTALLGDAATGFLPTAGVGASMAMDSATALVDELSRMDHNHVEYALKLYTQRQKDRVERAQDDSRKFGRFMFLQSGLLSSLRDRVLTMYSLQRMLSDISKIMEGR